MAFEKGKITLSIIKDPQKISGIPHMEQSGIRIMRLSGKAVTDKTTNIKIKNTVNEYHFTSKAPLAMYNPKQGSDPLFVIGTRNAVDDLEKQLRKIKNLDTDGRVRIDRPISLSDKAYLLNLYLKYRAVQMFDTSGIAITADKGLSFLQTRGRKDMMIGLSFQEKDGSLVLSINAVNVYRVNADAKEYDIAFVKVSSQYGDFMLKTFSESANIQRYRIRKGREGSGKSNYLEFTRGKGNFDQQMRMFESGTSIGACIEIVTKILREGGINLEFVQVDSVSPGFSFRKGTKEQWQKGEDALVKKTIRERVEKGGLQITGTSNVPDSEVKKLADIVRELFSDTLDVPVFADDDGKPMSAAADITAGPMPDSVLSAFGMPYQFPLRKDKEGYCHNVEKMNSGDLDDSYRKISRILLRCVPESGKLEIPVRSENPWCVEKIRGIPGGGYGRKAFDMVSSEEGKYQLILQRDEEDEEYAPSLNRQYITLDTIQDISSCETAVMTALRELLCIKADLSEGILLSSSRNLAGTSVFWHQKEFNKYWNIKICIGEGNRIGTAYFSEEEKNLEENNSDILVLSFADGRIFEITYAKDVRQIIAPVKDEKTVLSRALSHPSTDYEFNILGNTGFRHFTYQDRDFYLVGYNDELNWDKSGYAYYPAIYEVEKWVDGEIGEALTDQDWIDILSLCYTPLVSTQKKGTVYPFLKKYADEMLRVSMEYLEARENSRKQ